VVVTLFVLVLVTSAGPLWLARHVGSLLPIWVPNGIVVGSLLVMSRRRWPWPVAAAFVALALGEVITHGGPRETNVLSGLALAAGDCIEILIVASLIRRAFPRIADDTQFLLLGRIALGATLLGSVVSALLAAVELETAHDVSFWLTANTWFRAHVLGMVIVGTLSLVTVRRGLRVLGEPGRRLRMLRDASLLVLVAVVVFGQSRYPLLFVVFAPLLYMVFQHRFPGLVIGIALVALVTTFATALGHGPFDLIPDASASERALLAQIYLGVLCVVAVPVALALADRRRLARQVGDSENRYRLLADYASDLVLRIARDGTRRYVSPSVKDMLGWEVAEFTQLRGQLIHPDDREITFEAAERLWETGRPSLTRYRLRRRSGEYMWIEALARVAPSPDHEGEMELVYTGRDVTEDVEAEQRLAESEKRLRTITDNMPAIIAHVDLQQRYTFVNGYVGEVVGIDPEKMLGRTIEDVRGAEAYALLEPHITLALSGTVTTFEYDADYGKGRRYFQTTYLPATSATGERNGMYILTTDVTRIKQAEQQLAILARQDTLTGIPNRLSFREGIELSIQRASLTHAPLLLMLIDIDHFKQINDTYGHAAGDEALCAVAARLKSCVRRTDLLARLGGDEFVILCHDIESVADAEALARKIEEAMQPPVMIDTKSLQVSLSIGLALHRNVTSADALLHLADEALYDAKARGRARYRISASGI